jgi:hypothetical protein
VNFRRSTGDKNVSTRHHRIYQVYSKETAIVYGQVGVLRVDGDGTTNGGI